jgi:hypothetical protein
MASTSPRPLKHVTGNETSEQLPAQWSPAASTDDKRRHPRRAVARPVTLCGAGGRTLLRGCMIDMSRSGMYALFPPASGIAVGQCYTIRMHRDAGTPRGTALERAGTVIRTGLYFGEDEDRLGVAMRFDRHLPHETPPTT